MPGKPAGVTRLLEPVYREAMKLDDETLNGCGLRSCVSSLCRYPRNEDLEKAMHIRYVSRLLEKVIFGTLVMEPPERKPPDYLVAYPKKILSG